MSNRPRPPKFLNSVGKKEWTRVIQLLDEEGRLDPLGLSALQGYCRSYQSWYDCATRLATEEDDKVASRLLEELNLHHRHMRDFARDLALPANTQTRPKHAEAKLADDDSAYWDARLEEELARTRPQ